MFALILAFEIFLIGIIAFFAVFGKRNKQFRDPGQWILLTGAISVVFLPVILVFAYIGEAFFRDVLRIVVKW